MHQQEVDPSEREGQLVSIQVGQPATHHDDVGEWTTGFFKAPVSGAVAVNATKLEGDGQADLKHHGGVDKSVLAYAASHYADWRAELQIESLPHGAFGENLTIAQIDERTTCIGDVWKLGDVLLEVSQPRRPCWKLNRRWGRKDLLKRVMQSGRTGWYFRVQQTGVIQAGQAIELISRPHADWTITRANTVFYGADRDQKLALAALPELSPTWKQTLSE